MLHLYILQEERTQTMTKTLWTAVAAGLLYCAVANAKDIGKKAPELPVPTAGTYQISCYAADRNGWGLSAWCFRIDTRTGMVVKLDPDKIPQE